MIIKTKFKVGEHAFIIRKKSEQSETDCDTCGGTGKVHIRETGAEMRCPDCYGIGTHTNTDYNFYKEDVIVNKILTTTNENGTEIILSIFVDGQYSDIHEDYVFTAKEADKLIEKRNADKYVAPFFGHDPIIFDPYYMKFTDIPPIKLSGTSSNDYNGATIVDISTGKEIPKKLF